MTNKSFIFICTPTSDGKVSTQYHHSVLNLTEWCLNNGVKYQSLYCTGSNLPKMRNYQCEYFYRNIKYSHLLFIDSDMSFEPSLIQKMLLFDKPFVGALCPHKASNGKFVCSEHLINNKIGSFQQSTAIGTGILLLQRVVFDNLRQKQQHLFVQHDNYYKNAGLDGFVFQPFNHLTTMNGLVLSEDLSFARRWTNTGGEIWVCVDETIGHIGITEYKGCYCGDD